MRVALLALAALLLVPGTASAGCVRKRERVMNAEETRTAVVACGTVLRRGFLTDDLRHRPRGVLIGDVSAAAGRIAWIETRFTRRHRTIVLRVVRRQRPFRSLRREVLLRDRSDDVPTTDVVITPRRELAWLVPRRDTWVEHQRVVLERPDGERELLEEGDIDSLALDDGFTLRTGGAPFGFHDLPRPGRRACPRRDRYRVLADDGVLRVTERHYGGFEGPAVLRACVRGVGPDRPLVQTEEGFGNGDYALLAGTAGPLLALAVTSTSRYNPCDGWTDLTTYDARTGAALRRVELPRCGPDEPPRRWVSAVTADGVVAWTKGDRLLVAGPDGKPAELDRGAIGDLRSEGALLRWSRDGEPRSADPP